MKSYSLFKTMEIRFSSSLALLHLFFPWKALVNDQPAVLNTASGHISFLRGYTMCVSLLKSINEQVCVHTLVSLSVGPCVFRPLLLVMERED